MEKYKNKRMMHRKGGRFAKLTASDFGIGGACPNCRHLLIRVYEGDPNNIDPRAFRYRCFTCEPETEQEEAAKVQKDEARFSLSDFFKAAEQSAVDACPECGEEYSGACGSCAVGHERG